jgi:hypothetical protein
MQFAPTQNVKMNQKAYVGAFVISLCQVPRGPDLLFDFDELLNSGLAVFGLGDQNFKVGQNLEFSL